MISVIVTLYNKEQSVVSCLQSLVAQTAQQWECIIIDNASTDASEYQIRSYLIDRRMRYVRLPQKVSTDEARQAGLRATRGELVVFVDGGDYLESNALQALYLTLKKYGTEAAANNFATMRGGEKIPDSYLPEGKITARQIQHGKIRIVTSSTIFKRETAAKPETWHEIDYGYSDHLIAIWGDGEAPLVEYKKESFFKRLFKW